VVPGVVPTLSATPGRITGLGPALGDATDAVMRDLLGLAAGEVARLRAQRII
jgi:succinyl-CoA:(S)-malate CoA-transferase subunit A